MRKSNRIVLLHYSVPPVVGGVESVILSQARLLSDAQYSLSIIAGDGESQAFPSGVDFTRIPELSTSHPEIVQASLQLEQGLIPSTFDKLVERISSQLIPLFHTADRVIVHNVFTKHFNLPLTAALCQLLGSGSLPGCIAWCHDITWTSENSRSKVFPGYPWDLLRTRRDDIRYVTISQLRQHELAGLFNCPDETIAVVYNGVDPQELLGLSKTGMDLFERLGLWDADLILLMPVRVTQAKNIELAIRVAESLKERGLRLKIILTGPPDPHDQNNMTYYQKLLALRHDLNVDDEMRFVFESGPEAGQFFTIDMSIVAELYRVSDALFMPSHREGFGMPIVEAGLAGLPVFSTPIPAASELGGDDVTTFAVETDPADIAELIIGRMEQQSTWQLRRRVRQKLTWRSLLQRDMLPLLDEDTP